MTGGLIFALSEFMVGRILCGHLNLVMSASWAPWVLLQLARCADGRPGAARGRRGVEGGSGRPGADATRGRGTRHRWR